MLEHTGRNMLIYAGLAALMGLLFIRLPTSFLPTEDQGWMLVFVQAPVGATAIRTNQVLDKVQDHFLNTEKKTVESVFTVQGFSFSGVGQNAGIGFILLKDWAKRQGADQSVAAVAGRAWGPFSQIKDGLVFPIVPPAVTELGTSSGFDFYLKDEGGTGHEALIAARNQLLGMAAKDKRLTGVRAGGSEDSPQYRLDIDAERASALGVSMDAVNETLALAWGGRYIDDFIDRGKTQARVRAGRCAVSHAAGRLQSLVRAERRRARWCRCRRSPPRTGNSARRSCERFNGVPGGRDQRRGGARGVFGRGDEGSSSRSSPSSPPGSASTGPGSPTRSAPPARRRRSCTRCR